MVDILFGSTEIAFLKAEKLIIEGMQLFDTFLIIFDITLSVLKPTTILPALISRLRTCAVHTYTVYSY